MQDLLRYGRGKKNYMVIFDFSIFDFSCLFSASCLQKCIVFEKVLKWFLYVETYTERRREAYTSIFDRFWFFSKFRFFVLLFGVMFFVRKCIVFWKSSKIIFLYRNLYRETTRSLKIDFRSISKISKFVDFSNF